MEVVSLSTHIASLWTEVLPSHLASMIYACYTLASTYDVKVHSQLVHSVQVLEIKNAACRSSPLQVE
jgi:hypothetical protein